MATQLLLNSQPGKIGKKLQKNIRKHVHNFYQRNLTVEEISKPISVEEVKAAIKKNKNQEAARSRPNLP